MGTGGWHWWAGTGGWHFWAQVVTLLMISADPRSENCRFSAVLSSRSDRAAVIGLLPRHMISC
ncbi:unnamed protein product, partial [Staurois parvus]